MSLPVVRYVLGFAFDAAGRVALTRKNRPDWQAGLLNGVGGHIEPGEEPAAAMRREFGEETGADIPEWEPVAHLVAPGCDLVVYRAWVTPAVLDGLRTLTDETVVVVSADEVWAEQRRGQMVANLSWLLPLAAHTASRYDLVHVRERETPAGG